MATGSAVSRAAHTAGRDRTDCEPRAQGPRRHLTHLDRLEAESIHVSGVMAEAENPVMLYSVGKDSSVMLHLARKAFYPCPPPFPLLHVDTRWKFQAMYDFRTTWLRDRDGSAGAHQPRGRREEYQSSGPRSALHTDVMKTQSLKQASITQVRRRTCARRDEKSPEPRSVFSFRTSAPLGPKEPTPRALEPLQRPRNRVRHRVFLLSNGPSSISGSTSTGSRSQSCRSILRPSVPWSNAMMPMMADDDRLTAPDDDPMKDPFRTLGCYLLTGAIESDADDLASIVLELPALRPASARDG